MLNQQDLMEIINKGENAYVEFKEEKIKSNDLAGEIVSFANMEGGTIIIGVSDDGIIKGVSIVDIEERIMNICRNNCIPNIIPIYQEVIIDEFKVVVVTIPKGVNKPYYTNLSQSGSYSINFFYPKESKQDKVNFLNKPSNNLFISDEYNVTIHNITRGRASRLWEQNLEQKKADQKK